MHINDFEIYIYQLFGVKKEIKGELEITNKYKNTISKIGYATNMTPDVIREAGKNNVDLIVTHHDAWDFIFGLKTECQSLLKKNKINHAFVHLPLDSCDFGTNATLMNIIGAKCIKKVTLENGYYCGRIGMMKNGISYNALVKKVENACGEKVMHWKYNNRVIKKIGIVCGGGSSTKDMKEMVDNKCDAYITGEKVLYTIEYAKHVGINLIVGSHTFTELPGVSSLAAIISNDNNIPIIKLNEKHVEIQK